MYVFEANLIIFLMWDAWIIDYFCDYLLEPLFKNKIISLCGILSIVKILPKN